MVIGRATVEICMLKSCMTCLNSLLREGEIAARDDVEIGLAVLCLHDVLQLVEGNQLSFKSDSTLYIKTLLNVHLFITIRTIDRTVRFELLQLTPHNQELCRQLRQLTA